MPDTYVDSTGETRDKATGRNVNPPADYAGAGAGRPV